MTPEEKLGATQEIIDLFQRRDEFELRLRILAATVLPPRVKNYRIKLLTREIIALKGEVNFKIVALNARTGNADSVAILERWASEGYEPARTLLANLKRP